MLMRVLPLLLVLLVVVVAVGCADDATHHHCRPAITHNIIAHVVIHPLSHVANLCHRGGRIVFREIRLLCVDDKATACATQCGRKWLRLRAMMMVVVVMVMAVVATVRVWTAVRVCMCV